MRKNLKSKIQTPKSSGPKIQFTLAGDETSFKVEALPSGQIEVRRTGSSEPESIDVPPERWERFWDEIEKIGVWKWKAEYLREASHGISWQLELSHGVHRVKARGRNAYPECEDADSDVHYPPGGRFDRFIQAIARLAAIPVDQIGSEPSDYD